MEIFQNRYSNRHKKRPTNQGRSKGVAMRSTLIALLI